jgi:hypothetical protein
VRSKVRWDPSVDLEVVRGTGALTSCYVSPSFIIE